MKYRTEVVKQECCGDEGKLTLGNVQRITAVEWLEHGDSICVNVPLSKLKNYSIGRIVTIDIKPC